ncbi:hypothetical protein H072_3932 [Dactylellina haptotyla CBS 200.50]|uniref:BRCT domain-containing protein n=1 Tax=Dactylellina haptotyla (strain CBS 200.50) TaxID=1284197 RepID=S8AGU5_DACHA|nr:hypothetical protein H072_3932 [Dactylellina haptotyla CBS 200.50]
MDATPALRRSARNLQPPASRRLPPRASHARRAVSAPKPRTTTANKHVDSMPVENILKSSRVTKPLAAAPKSILKKSVRFVDVASSPVACNKENDLPSEDELVAATIVPTPKKPFPATPETSSIKSVSHHISLSQSRSVSHPINFQQTAELKRKYSAEEETPKSRRKIARVDGLAAHLKEPESPTMSRKMAHPVTKVTATPVSKTSSSMLRTPKLVAPTPSRPGLHETPAKRPIKPLKDTTPAIRAPVIQEAGNPFESSVRKDGPIRMSAMKKPINNDIFASSDSFVCPSNSSKGWQFGSNIAIKPSASLPIHSLATPARRPVSGLLSASTVAVEKQKSTLSRSLMSCPPKRPALPVSPSTPTSKKTDVTAKLNNLATPARRPDFSFAQPTKSSIAKSTPPRVSPLKEAPKRGPGLSPLKSTVTMEEIKQKSSPIRDSSVSPVRKPYKPGENVSPSRNSLFSKSSNIFDDLRGPKKDSALTKPSQINSARKASAPLSPIRNSLFGSRQAQTERKTTVTRHSDIFQTTNASPTNRKLNFSIAPTPSKKSPKKADFDIFVDDAAPKASAYDFSTELADDSMTTEEVFANSPPKTLGTRRESGLFLTSPDRSISIGPFTTRLDKKSSPLRKEYEADIRRASGGHLGRSPSGNFFLDIMHESNLTTTIPSLVHKQTYIVPLKGCAEESEESDNEEIEIQENTLQTSKGPLSDMVVFVEIRTSDGADASASFVQELLVLGARVVKRWRVNTFGKTNSDLNPMGVNLVVFKDGNSQAINKAKRVGVPCVGVAWIKQCSTQNEKAPFDEFLITNSKGLFGAKKQRRNSLVPKLHKCVTGATPRKDSAKKPNRLNIDGPSSNPATPCNMKSAVKTA